MIERLPARVRTPAVARAMFSPSALLLAGAAMSAGILAGLPLVAAGAVGAAGWALRVAAAVPRQPAGERIDPQSVREPWRHFVVDALEARARFQRSVERCRAGPLRERLESLGRRLDDGVSECWRIARQGDVLESALGQLEVDGVQRELAQVQREPPGDARDRTERALQSQLAAAHRLASVARDARDRLRVLNAQLDEAVARAVELSVGLGDVRGLQPVSQEVDVLVGDLEALRQALEETVAQGAHAPAEPQRQQRARGVTPQRRRGYDGR